MNLVSLALVLALIIGLTKFSPSSNPIVFTILSIVLLIHLTNHTYKTDQVEKPKH